jgi:ribosomal protein S18 acetylase RimI-like enzyme
MNRTLTSALAPDQQTFLVRESGQDDSDSIREFVCGLSPQSQYFRFFASAAPPSTSLLRALCGGTGADILVITDQAGTIVGHGMAADSAGPGLLATDIGLVIADRWQQLGLGTMLLDALVRRASGRGVRQLVLDVLPANDRMLGIIGRRWPAAPRELTRDAIVIRPVIGPAAATARPAALVRIDSRQRQAARQPAA